MNLVLHEQTLDDIARLTRARPQSIGIVAPMGAGKSTLARHLAAQLLGLRADELSKYAYFYALEPEPKKNSASVESVRSFLAQMNRAVPGAHPTRRVVLLENADKLLRTDAQNVLLKFIEEPPQDTVIILTYASETALLTTVRSRLQAMTLRMPLKAALVEYFSAQGYKSADIARAYGLSGGLPGMMTALLTDEQQHPLVAAVESAKKLLAADTFERLAMIDELAKADLAQLFFAIRQIARAAMTGAAQKEDGARAIPRWSRIYAQASVAEVQRAGHVQTKLLLTNFVLQL